EPARVLGLEPRQATVRRIGPPARRPPGPVQRGLPPLYPGEIGLPARLEDPDQLLGGREMAPGKVVAGRADRDSGRPRDIADPEPGALPERRELVAEVGLGRDPPRIRVSPIDSHWSPSVSPTAQKSKGSHVQKVSLSVPVKSPALRMTPSP